MNVSHLFLLTLALVCFVLSAWRVDEPTWQRLVSVGFAALTLSMI